MNMKKNKRKRQIRPWAAVYLLIAIFLVIWAVYSLTMPLFHHAVPSVTEQPQVATSAESTPVPTLDPEQDPRFLDTNSILLCANKKHPLAQDYAPADLVTVDVPQKYGNAVMRKEAAEAMKKMFDAAKVDGVSLFIGTGFRDYAFQESIYNGYVSQSGQEYADTISSRPGYSDHQTGLCADLGGPDEETYLEQSFINTPAGQWLYKHAYEYGFIMRYPNGKEDVTGYSYEPWHYRYVGVDVATDMYNISPELTFEEYFDIAGGNYPGKD